MVTRFVIAIAVMFAAGCMESNLVECSSTGLMCPPGKACAPDEHSCVWNEQLTTCAGVADGSTCSFRGVDGACAGGTCVPLSCGDGTVQADEDCEPSVAVTADCTRYGFYDAVPLQCTDGCRFDLTRCTGYCGDGEINGPEDCEGSSVGTTDCRAFGYYQPDGLTCGRYCTFDTSGCAQRCGDGAINGTEVCDPATDSATTCLDLHFDRGTLSCNATCGFDTSCDRLGWSEVATLEGSLNDIWSASPIDRYAAGEVGLFHSDGVTWTQLDAFKSYTFRGIWGAAPDDIYAVGDRGLVVHYNGVGWSLISIAGVSTDLRDVWGSGPNDIYIVGRQAILHGVGPMPSDWAPVTNLPDNAQPPPYDLLAVYGFGPNAVFVSGWHFLGSGCGPFCPLPNNTLLVFDGSGWTRYTGGSVVGSPRHALWGTDPGNVYLGTGTDMLLHFDGTLFGPVPVPAAKYTAIWGTASDDVFAAGDGILVHYDGAVWREVEETSGANVLAASVLPGTLPLGLTAAGKVVEYRSGGWNAPVGFGATRLFGSGTFAAASFGPGDVDPGETMTFDGVSWTELVRDGVSTASLFAPDDGFGLRRTSSKYTIVRFDGSSWTPSLVLVTGYLSDVWAGSTTNAIVVGSVTLRFDGTSWVDASQGLGTTVLRQVAGRTGEAYGLVSNQLYRFDGVSWSLAHVSASAADDVWVASSGDVFAVGYSAVTMQNGPTWSETANDPGVHLNAVSGRAPNDVWAAGNAGMIAHYDGNVAHTWAITQLPTTEDVVDIWASSTHLIAATTSGVLYHYSGGSWSATPEGGTLRDLHAVVVRQDGVACAVGDGGVIVEGRTAWQPIVSPTSSALRAITRIDVGGMPNLIAVGDAGTALAYNGTTWNALSSMTSVDLRGVAANANGVVVAVGDSGTALLYANGTFVSIAPPTTARLRGVWISPLGHVFVVGDAGTILEYDGLSWQTHTTGITASLAAVWGAATGDVFAVGDGGTMLRYYGGTWTTERSMTTKDLTSIYGTTATDVLATGRGGVVLHRGARGWGPVHAPISTDLLGIDVDGSEVYVVGATGTARALFRVGVW